MGLNKTDYDDVKAGQVLRVPTSYAKSIELWIDKELMLPIRQVIFDDKGKYEEYEYRSLVVNPKHSLKVFDPETLGKEL